MYSPDCLLKIMSDALLFQHARYFAFPVVLASQHNVVTYGHFVLMTAVFNWGSD